MDGLLEVGESKPMHSLIHSRTHARTHARSIYTCGYIYRKPVAAATAASDPPISVQVVMAFLNQLPASLAVRKQTDLGYPMCNIPRARSNAPSRVYIYGLVGNTIRVAAYTRICVRHVHVRVCTYVRASDSCWIRDVNGRELLSTAKRL